MTVGNDHQFCGDNILALMREVERLRERLADIHNVRRDAIALDPSVRHLFETGVDHA